MKIDVEAKDKVKHFIKSLTEQGVDNHYFQATYLQFQNPHAPMVRYCLFILFLALIN